MFQTIHVIERRRKELGMSTAELCRLTQIPEATYRNMVSGRSLNEPVPTIHALALAVHMTIGEVISLATGEAHPETVETLSNIAHTPATTQEVDTGFTLLSRAIEKNASEHKDELRILKEHFDQIAAIKDAVAARERKGLIAAILALLGLCAALIAVICLELVL